MLLEISPAKTLSGEISVPGDKSISHRAVMAASLCGSEVAIDNFLESEDCMRTIGCFEEMGVAIEKQGTVFKIKGAGLKGLKAPKNILYAGNSGTTIRLLLGILAGQPFQTSITGDESIKRRPMLRVVEPLRSMGAVILGRESGNFAPLEIKGGDLNGIDYKLPVASAQIKSALLFAGLFANGQTILEEPSASRDHTERMFAYLGIPFIKSGNRIIISKCDNIAPKDINVPGDISSAAFFMVAASIVPGSKVLIRNVGLNPTRTGIIDVLHRMGANIKIQNEASLSGEPRGDILVTSSKLKGIEISGNVIPRIIDEIPIIAVAAAVAEGQTIIKDAKELRVKESDRIKTVALELGKLGADIKELDDGMIIEGETSFTGAECDSHGDHRIAMSLAVAALCADDDVTIQDTDCIDTSFPGFEKSLSSLIG